MARARRAVFGTAFLLVACGDNADVYTLYRASPLDENVRIHIATFDADEVADYNQENCRIAADLFANYPGVTVRYWCEQGRFKPNSN